MRADRSLSLFLLLFAACGTPATPPGTADMAVPCTGTTTACGGACVDLKSDARNCGACGTACASDESCSNGACTLMCATGKTLCGKSCVTLANDPQNCGACG